MESKVKELVERIDYELTNSGLLNINNPELYVDRLGMRSLLKNCKAELKRLEAENTWQPIETAPRDGRYLLMLRYGASLPDILQWNDSVSMWADCVFEGSKKSKKAIEKISWEQNITYWRPLPACPIKNNGG